MRRRCNRAGTRPYTLRHPLLSSTLLSHNIVFAHHYSQAHAGIQKLLTAEHEATEVVKTAKDGARAAGHSRVLPAARLRRPETARTGPLRRRLSPFPPCTPLLLPAEKVARLKQAKAEATAEIEAYKASREAQFQIFSKERLGDSAGVSTSLAKTTEAELATISSDVSKNKQKVIDMLLKSVTTVA